MSDASAIFEVMSSGTARRDRHDKWAAYQTLESLKHYVLVQRDAPHIEVFDRKGEDWDGLRIVDGLQAELALPSLEIALPLREIYADLF